jgi:hypothetical protein
MFVPKEGTKLAEEQKLVKLKERSNAEEDNHPPNLTNPDTRTGG